MSQVLRSGRLDTAVASSSPEQTFRLMQAYLRIPTIEKRAELVALAELYASEAGVDTINGFIRRAERNDADGNDR